MTEGEAQVVNMTTLTSQFDFPSSSQDMNQTSTLEPETRNKGKDQVYASLGEIVDTYLGHNLSHVRYDCA